MSASVICAPGIGRCLRLRRPAIFRHRHFTANRRHRSQIGDQRVEVARGEHGVELVGHDRRGLHAIRLDAGDEKLFQLGIAPAADTGFLVWRDVGADDLVISLVEYLRSAGQRTRKIETIGPARGVTAVAVHHAVDEIGAALDQRLTDEPAIPRAASANPSTILIEAPSPLAPQKSGARWRRFSIPYQRAYAASASAFSCTGPESLPLASTSRSTNSMTAIAALSP